MSQKDVIEVEYEARLMVDEKTYLSLLEKYRKEEHVELVNVNTYFDSEDKYLTNHHMVLRVREIDESKNELTLKIKGENGDEELNHILTISEYKGMLEKNILPECSAKEKLLELKIDLTKLKKITTLKTERLEVHYSDHIFVIDKNYFRNKVDFNVEVESTSKNSAISYLNDHVKEYGLSYKKGYISKSRRAILDL